MGRWIGNRKAARRQWDCGGTVAGRWRGGGGTVAAAICWLLLPAAVCRLPCFPAKKTHTRKPRKIHMLDHRPSNGYLLPLPRCLLKPPAGKVIYFPGEIHKTYLGNKEVLVGSTCTYTYIHIYIHIRHDTHTHVHIHTHTCKARQGEGFGPIREAVFRVRVCV